MHRESDVMRERGKERNTNIGRKRRGGETENATGKILRRKNGRGNSGGTERRSGKKEAVKRDKKRLQRKGY